MQLDIHLKVLTHPGNLIHFRSDILFFEAFQIFRIQGYSRSEKSLLLARVAELDMNCM